MEAVRTNNDLEGWHNGLNRRTKGRSQLPLYIFIQVLHWEASLVNMQIRLVSDKKLKRHQRSAYRAMQRRLFNLWKQYEDGQRNSKELLEACPHNINFNKDKQTQTTTAPLGATNSLKVNNQQFKYINYFIYTSHQQFFSSQLGGESSKDLGRIVQRLGANCPETGGESSGANCLWGELSRSLVIR